MSSSRHTPRNIFSTCCGPKLKSHEGTCIISIWDGLLLLVVATRAAFNARVLSFEVDFHTTITTFTSSSKEIQTQRATHSPLIHTYNPGSVSQREELPMESMGTVAGLYQFWEPMVGPLHPVVSPTGHFFVSRMRVTYMYESCQPSCLQWFKYYISKCCQGA